MIWYGYCAPPFLLWAYEKFGKHLNLQDRTWPWLIWEFHFSCRFVDQVNATIALLHPIHCTRDRKVDVEFDLTTIPAFLIVLGILYVLLKPRRPKPKINWDPTLSRDHSCKVKCWLAQWFLEVFWGEWWYQIFSPIFI